MQTLTYVVGTDKRALVSDVQNFQINWSTETTYNWVQARQYENSMRQVFVNVKNANDTPFDLTGCNIWFEGLLPDDTHRILDAKHATVIDAQSGQFRFDFPAQAFAVAGSYKQAFFRIVRDGMSVTTLEFDLEILADKVISGVVATDYITPFEDLYNQLEEILTNADGDLQAKLSEWTQEYNAKVQELTALGTSVTNSLTSVQNRLATFEMKIQEDGLFTQGEAEEFKKSVKSDLEDLFTDVKQSMENQTVNDFSSLAISDPQNMYAEEMPLYFNDTFNHATNIPHGDNIVNIAFITDNHHQEDVSPWSNKAYSGKSLEHYQWFAQGTLRTKPDIAIANGDNINGDTYRPTLVWTTMHVWAMLSTVYLKTALFMLPGNHDTGIGQKPKLVAEDALTEHDLKNAYHTIKPLYGEVRNDDSLYFYKDLTDKKVRVIGLNSSDMPWTTDSQGNYVHNRLEEAGFSVAQLKWLADVALKLPDNSWQVVFFFHHPLSNSTFYNAQALIDIIKAFKNGGSVVINRSDVDDMQIVGLKADFTTQGAGTVIGVFNGHYHTDSQDLTTLNGTPIVITDASLSNFSPIELKRRNTPNEDCWETISIDTTTRTIHCYRFGRGSDREFNY